MDESEVEKLKESLRRFGAGDIEISEEDQWYKIIIYKDDIDTIVQVHKSSSLDTSSHELLLETVKGFL